MNREGAFAKNTFILALGVYLPKLTTIITLPLLTGYLTKAEYGTYDLITTLVSLLLPAITLQIQSAAFRFLISCRGSKDKVTDVVTNIFAFTIPVSIIGLTLTFFAFGSSLSVLTRFMIICYFFLDIIYIGCGQVTRGLGKNFIYASSAVVVPIANMVGICVALLWMKNGLDGLLLSMILSCFLGIILLAYRIKIYLYISWKKISLLKIKELLAYSWPMVPNALSNWVLSLSDRLVILKFMGIESNAIYSVANKIPHLLKNFQGVLASAWQENASLSVKDLDSTDYYSKMLDSINRLIVGTLACLMVFTPLLFTLLIRGDYDSAYHQMPILYLGMYFSCMAEFLGGIYIAHMKTKSVGLTTMGAAVCNLVINLLLINYIGIYAASISTLAAYALLFTFRLVNIYKFQPIKVSFLKLGFYLLILLVMSVLVYMRNTVINILNAVIGITFAVFINLDIIRVIIAKAINKVSKK